MKARTLSVVTCILGIGVAILAVLDSRPRHETSETSETAAIADVTFETATVWASPPARTYFCPGDQRHGPGEGGTYLTEVEANARGFVPAQGRGCR